MNLGDFQLRTCGGCVTIIQGKVPVGFNAGTHDLVKIVVSQSNMCKMHQLGDSLRKFGV
jgi:hypothetical protein